MTDQIEEWNLDEEIPQKRGFLQRLRDLWIEFYEVKFYEFKCMLFHRYTTVKPRSLNHGWFDRSGLMIHMMFEILAQYVEKEDPFEFVEWGFDDDPNDWEKNHRHVVVVDGAKKLVGQEIKDLYDWWVSHNYAIPEMDYDWVSKYLELKKGNLDDRAKAAQLLTRFSEGERSLEADILDRMHRLVNIAGYLWT